MAVSVGVRTVLGTDPGPDPVSDSHQQELGPHSVMQLGEEGTGAKSEGK